MHYNFSIDPQAWSYLDKSVNTHYLRIGLKNYGCSGFGYDFQPVSNCQKNDYCFKHEQFTLKILINKKDFHRAFEGAILILKKTDFGQEINLKNPNIEEHCGCGHSFTIKEQILELS